MSGEVVKQEGVLCICGEITIYGATAHKNDLFAALEGDTDGCTLDLAQVSELDTTGLRILLMAH